MTEPLTNQLDDDDDLSPFERKLIFDGISRGDVILNIDDELFKKNSKELALENNPYGQYRLELAAREKNLAAHREKIKLDLAALEDKIKLDLAAREEQIKLDLAARACSAEV